METMNLKSLSRKASTVVCLALVVLVLVQQYRLNRAVRNETSADRTITRLYLENADLRKRLENP